MVALRLSDVCVVVVVVVSAGLNELGEFAGDVGSVSCILPD